MCLVLVSIQPLTVGLGCDQLILQLLPYSSVRSTAGMEHRMEHTSNAVKSYITCNSLGLLHLLGVCLLLAGSCNSAQCRLIVDTLSCLPTCNEHVICISSATLQVFVFKHSINAHSSIDTCSGHMSVNLHVVCTATGSFLLQARH
jgi:proline racemase